MSNEVKNNESSQKGSSHTSFNLSDRLNDIRRKERYYDEVAAEDSFYEDTREAFEDIFPAERIDKSNNTEQSEEESVIDEIKPIEDIKPIETNSTTDEIDNKKVDKIEESIETKPVEGNSEQPIVNLDYKNAYENSQKALNDKAYEESYNFVKNAKDLRSKAINSVKESADNIAFASEKDRLEYLKQSQSSFDVVKNMVMGFTNNVVHSAINETANLAVIATGGSEPETNDIPELIGDQQNPFYVFEKSIRQPLNSFLQQFRSSIQGAQAAKNEEYEIHTGDESENNMFTNPRYAAEKFAELGNTVGAMTPSMIATMGAGSGIKIAGGLIKSGGSTALNAAAKTLAKYSPKTLATIRNASTSTATSKVGGYLLNKTKGKAAGLANAAIGGSVMRLGESEGQYSDTLDRVYESAVSQLSEMNNDELAVFVDNNPEFKGMNAHDIATSIAIDSAQKSWDASQSLVALDIAQWAALPVIFKGANLSPIAKSAQDKALSTISNIKTPFTKTAANALKKTGLTLGFEVIPEGLEEGYLYAATEIAVDEANQVLDSDRSIRKYSDFLDDPMAREATIMGMIGGGIFTGFGYIQNKAAERQLMRDVANSDGSVESINSHLAQAEEISSRVDKLSLLAKDISNTESKTTILDDYINDLAITSLENDTFDLATEFVGSDQYADYLEQNDINFDDNLTPKETANVIKDKLKKAKYVYEKTKTATNVALDYQISNNIDSILKDSTLSNKDKTDKINIEINRGEYIKRQIARVSALNQLYSDSVGSNITNIDRTIQTTAENDIYKRYSAANAVNDALKKLTSIEANYSQSDGTNNQSIQLQGELFSSQYRALLDYITADFGYIPSDTNLSTIEQLNEFVANNDTISTADSDVVMDVTKNDIDYLTNLNIKKYNATSAIPRTQTEFNKTFDGLNAIFTNKQNEVLESAINEVIDYINNNVDFDKKDIDASSDLLNRILYSEIDEIANAQAVFRLASSTSTNYLDNVSVALRDIFAKVINDNSDKLGVKLMFRNSKYDISPYKFIEDGVENMETQTNEDIAEQDSTIIDQDISSTGQDQESDYEYNVPDTYNETIREPTEEELAGIDTDNSDTFDISPEEDQFLAEQDDMYRRQLNISGSWREVFNMYKDRIPELQSIYDVDKTDEYNEVLTKIRGYVESKENFSPLDSEEVAKQAILDAYRLSKSISNMDSTIPANINDTIDVNHNVYLAIEELIVDYKKSTKSKSNKVDLMDFASYIINKEGVSIDIAKTIINNTIGYKNATRINAVVEVDESYGLKFPYKFYNIKKFNNSLDNIINEIRNYRKTEATVDSRFHTRISNTKTVFDENGNEVPLSSIIDNLNKGDELRFVQNMSGTAISIQDSNGNEVAYIATVKPNKTGNGFSLNKPTSGLVHTVSKESVDGRIVYKDTVDDFFEGLINESTSEHKELFALLFEVEVLKSNGDYNKLADVYDKLRNNKLYSEFISKIKVPNRITGTNKDSFIANIVNNVLFYKLTDNKKVLRRNYNAWKQNVYTNYNQTFLMQIIPNNTVLKFDSVNKGDLLISDVNTDISDDSLNFNSEDNKVVIFKDGVIIRDGDGKEYINRTSLQTGNMGLIVDEVNGVPMVARFTASNKILETNKELHGAIFDELNDLFSDFVADDFTQDRYDVLFAKMQEFLGGINSDGVNLFSGFSVIPMNKGFGLKHNASDKIVMYATPKGKLYYNVSGNVDNETIGYDLTKYKTLTKSLARRIANTLSYNRSFEPILNRNKVNNNDGRYVNLSDGNIVINVGNKTFNYSNYTEFILSNNAFKTNQGINNNVDSTRKSRFFTGETTYKDSMFLEVVEVTDGAETIITQTTNLDSLENGQEISSKDILTQAGIQPDMINYIDDLKSISKIDLIPESIIFSNKYGNAVIASADTKTGKVFVHKKLINSVKQNNSMEVLRALVHENLHNKIASYKDPSTNVLRTNVLTDLNETLSQFAKYLKEDINSSDKQTSDKAKTIYNKYKSIINAESKTPRILEEWLVESITQADLIDYLSTKTYNGVIDNNETETLWEKLFNTLLKIFGNITNYTKNNSILSKHKSIFNPSIDNQITNNVDNNDVDTIDIMNEFAIDEANTSSSDSTVFDENQTVQDNGIDLFGNAQEDVDINAELPDNSDVNFEDMFDGINIPLNDNIKTSTINYDYDDKLFDGSNATIVSDMESYINSFPIDQQQSIRDGITNGTIEFLCNN